MAEILPIRRKTLFNPSINIRMTTSLHTNTSLLVLSIQRKACFTKAVTNWRIRLILFATIATVQCRKQRTYVRNWKKHEDQEMTITVQTLIAKQERNREIKIFMDTYITRFSVIAQREAEFTATVESSFHIGTCLITPIWTCGALVKIWKTMHKVG